MPPFFLNTKRMATKRIEWFFSKTVVYTPSWHGFWHEHKQVMPTEKGTRLTLINFGWKNYGFFYFKEEFPHNYK